jgi:hypothetical protein
MSRTFVVALVGAILLAVGAGVVAHWFIPVVAVELRKGDVHMLHPPPDGPCAVSHLVGHVEDVRDFDIPAGKLPDSIFCFNAQSGLNAGWAGDNLSSGTPAVKGRMRALDALAMLVTNTDLEVVPPPGNISTVGLRLRNPSGPPCAVNAPWGRTGDVRDYNIPAGKTPQSLSCFAKQSGVDIYWPGNDADGRPTPAVTGHMSAFDAIRAMLVNTDLVVSADDKVVNVLVSTRPHANSTSPPH